jgi:hypothetical protein
MDSFSTRAELSERANVLPLFRWDERKQVHVERQRRAAYDDVNLGVAFRKALFPIALPTDESIRWGARSGEGSLLASMALVISALLPKADGD